MTGPQLFRMIMFFAVLAGVIGWCFGGSEAALQAATINLTLNYAFVGLGIYRWRP